MSRCLVYSIACLVFTPAVLEANNNLFMPGDAFFYFVITPGNVLELSRKDVDSRTFSYSIGGAYAGAFCGYAGYEQAIIPGIDDRMAANLALVYKRLRDGQKNKNDDRTRLDGIRVFVYAKSFDIQKFHLGLRYNENWVAETVKFGHLIDRIRLCCFVDDADAVMTSWRDSRRIPALKATLPKAEIREGKAIRDPITILGQIKVIVLPPVPLTKYFKRKDGLVLYQVDSKGVREFVMKDREWVAKTPN